MSALFGDAVALKLGLRDRCMEEIFYFICKYKKHLTPLNLLTIYYARKSAPKVFAKFAPQKRL